MSGFAGIRQASAGASRVRGQLLSEDVGCMGRAWIPDETWRIVTKKERGWIMGILKQRMLPHAHEHTHILRPRNRISATHTLFFFFSPQPVLFFHLRTHPSQAHTTWRTTHCNTWTGDARHKEVPKVWLCMKYKSRKINPGGSGWVSSCLWEIFLPGRGY